MQLTNSQKYTIGGFIIGLLILVWVFNCLIPNSEKTLLNGISLVGTYASIFGILIAYFQILSVKEATNETQESVKKALNSIQKVISVSDISKSIKTINEIEGYLKVDNFDLAVLRMKDLKYSLIQAKYDKNLLEFTSKSDFSDILLNLNVDLSNLSKVLFGKVKSINKVKIFENLGEVENQLIEFENKIKFSNNG